MDRSNLKQRYPNSNLVHFIEMYDDVISISIHCLNAYIFEDETYVYDLQNDIQTIEDNKEEHLVIEYMNICGWTNDEEKSISRLKQELVEAKSVYT
ncbi:hypothetical protein [Aureibacter tunicatorum]|uniref:Uncharacterized protein n=1 Tax=Aureibacter tunicatorum TaxID=866807 RepID=A0AAE3XPX6_9BACT|nr:hypothetical protein [Aureibacter tunicatorum]MDR6241866.1 hypothetical protein [Aureibacter tunicatorum]BDD07113.1 hypothetical protein AUTU_45960 [Aureibacter tunicatorum]